jgi:hypothetical protein
MTAPAAIRKIFISYDGSTGLALSKAINDALQSPGIDGWFFA